MIRAFTALGQSVISDHCLLMALNNPDLSLYGTSPKTPFSSPSLQDGDVLSPNRLVIYGKCFPSLVCEWLMSHDRRALCPLASHATTSHRFEEESKIAKALEAEKLLKEAEDAKRAAEHRKDAAAARRRYKSPTGLNALCRVSKMVQWVWPKQYVMEYASRMPCAAGSPISPKILIMYDFVCEYALWSRGARIHGDAHAWVSTPG